jgi:hypothetical protein
VIDHE